MMKPTPNAPNPKKFMEEMKVLVPHLTSQGHIPTGLNRETARKNGFKNVEKALHAQNERNRLQIEHEYRLQRIAERLDKELATRHPGIYRLVKWTTWVWVFKAIGYSWTVQGGEQEIDGVPGIQTSIILIHRFGKVVTKINMVWEDPKLKAKVKV